MRSSQHILATPSHVKSNVNHVLKFSPGCSHITTQRSSHKSYSRATHPSHNSIRKSGIERGDSWSPLMNLKMNQKVQHILKYWGFSQYNGGAGMHEARPSPRHNMGRKSPQAKKGTKTVKSNAKWVSAWLKWGALEQVSYLYKFLWLDVHLPHWYAYTILIDFFLFCLLAPLGALGGVVFLDRSKPSQANDPIPS